MKGHYKRNREISDLYDHALKTEECSWCPIRYTSSCKVCPNCKHPNPDYATWMVKKKLDLGVESK